MNFPTPDRWRNLKMTNRLPVIATAFAVVSLAIGSVFSVAAPSLAAQVVTCESSNNQRRTCSADTRYGVRIVRQISNSSCRGNWGYDRNRIWVKNGCRAEFLIGSRQNDRNDRYDRNDRNDRNDRYNRNDRNDRNDRYNRNDGNDRNDRYNRNDRYDRNDRYGR
ncbi:MAG: DUF3011 domain-containing protein [Crinalium sp.]